MSERAPPGSTPGAHGPGIAVWARAGAGRRAATDTIAAKTICLIFVFIIDSVRERRILDLAGRSQTDQLEAAGEVTPCGRTISSIRNKSVSSARR